MWQWSEIHGCHSKQFVLTTGMNRQVCLRRNIESMRIKYERTVPKTPQQNELAERMNHIIFEKVWNMLSHTKLSKIL